MATAVSISLWRRLVGVVGIALAFVGVVVLIYAVFSRQLPPGSEDDRTLAIGFFGFVTAAGAFLAHVGFPGIWSGLAQSSGLRLTSVSTLRHPIAHTLLLFIVDIVLAAIVPGKAAILTSFLVMCVFVVANPVLIATGPRWPLRALISAVCFVLLLGGGAGVAEAVSGQQFGDDAMIFLLPLMIYVVALPASGLFRLTAWFKKRQVVET
jgi:MFS family permease